MIEVGDLIMCIRDGGNNTCAGRFESVWKGDGPFIIKTIHKDGIYTSKSMKCNTLETECGKFLWNSEELFQVIEKGQNVEPQYEIY